MYLIYKNLSEYHELYVQSDTLLLSDVYENFRNMYLITQGGPEKCPFFSLAITVTKIRKASRFFLHRHWKFIEFFWCKPL